MSHWMVIKQDDMYCDGEDVLWGPRWCVKSPTGVGWGNYATHAEALAYADKRARTREVVLPGPDWLTRHGVQLDADRYRTSAKANSLKYGIYIDIPTQDLRPLALALLAHAERMGE